MLVLTLESQKGDCLSSEPVFHPCQTGSLSLRSTPACSVCKATAGLGRQPHKNLPTPDLVASKQKPYTCSSS